MKHNDDGVETLSGNSDDVRKNIKYVRKLRGYTQEYVANEMKITQSAVSQFELKGNIQHETLIRIGRVLDVHQLVLYMHDLHDEEACYHEIVKNVVLNYPKEEQFAKIGEEIQYELEQRRISMYTGSPVTPEEQEILSQLDNLNTQGKREALKRIQELAQLSQYKRKD